MEQKPNYYEILGLTPSATKDDIKKAYRVLAKKYHPDVYKGADATQKFEAITEAYNNLYDDDKRMMYDTFTVGSNPGVNNPPPPQYNQNTGPMPGQGPNPGPGAYYEDPFQRSNGWGNPYGNGPMGGPNPYQSQGNPFNFNQGSPFGTPFSNGPFENPFENPFEHEYANPFEQNANANYGSSFESPFSQNQQQNAQQNSQQFQQSNLGEEVFKPKFNPFADKIPEAEEEINLNQDQNIFNPFVNPVNDGPTFANTRTQPSNTRTKSFMSSLNKAYSSYDPNSFQETSNFLNIARAIEFSEDPRKIKIKVEVALFKIRKKLENYMYIKNNGKKTFEVKYGNRNFENIVIVSDETDVQVIGQPNSKITMAAGQANMASNDDEIGSFVECYGDNKTIVVVPNSNEIKSIKIGLPFSFRYKNIFFSSKTGNLAIFSSSTKEDLKFRKFIACTDEGLIQAKASLTDVNIHNEIGNTQAIIQPLNENAMVSLTTEEGSIDLCPQFQIGSYNVTSKTGNVSNVHQNGSYNYFVDLDIQTNKGNVYIR